MFALKHVLLFAACAALLTACSPGKPPASKAGTGVKFRMRLLPETVTVGEAPTKSPVNEKLVVGATGMAPNVANVNVVVA